MAAYLTLFSQVGEKHQYLLLSNMFFSSDLFFPCNVINWWLVSAILGIDSWQDEQTTPLFYRMIMIKIVVNNGMLSEAKRARLNHKLYFCKNLCENKLCKHFRQEATLCFYQSTRWHYNKTLQMVKNIPKLIYVKFSIFSDFSRHWILNKNGGVYSLENVCLIGRIWYLKLVNKIEYTFK